MTSIARSGGHAAALAAVGSVVAVASITGCTGGPSARELAAARQQAEATCRQHADVPGGGWLLGMSGWVSAPAGLPGVEPGTKVVQCGWGSPDDYSGGPPASCPPDKVDVAVGGPLRYYLITSRGQAVPLPADKVSPPPSCVPSSDVGHPVNIDSPAGWPSLP